MTLQLNHGPAKLCQVLNNSLAKKLATFLIVLVLSAGVSNAASTAELPTTKVEMAAPASGGTLIIALDHSAGAGASVSVELLSEYTSNYPGCGITAGLNGSNDKVIVYLPDSGCTPSGTMQMDCAVITTVDAAGDVVAVHTLIADGGFWEVVDTGI